MSDKDKTDEPKHDTQKSPISTRKAKKLSKLKEYLSKQESLKNSRKVSDILKKTEFERTEEEKKTLAENEVIVKRIHKNKERRLLSEQRILETEDNEQVLQDKCRQLAEEILQSKQTVIYTGAGISTAASIPDYRGPQGVWTLLQKGEQLTPQDLSDAEPTVTHMCITALQKKGLVAHVVSQNCDGLHLRSGLPRKLLSEVHGNMFIEVCNTCKPHREYIRLFDVTENTGVRRHQTGRLCKICRGELRDTIVHFGEKGGVKSPYRWKEAVRAANGCDLILCLGSSLKILKKYSCLWCMDRARNKRPKLVIINLQWTPKDSDSFLKINGRCDDVLQRVMKILKSDIPTYSRNTDPIYLESINLEKEEQNSISKKTLVRPESLRHIPLKTMPRSPTPSLSSDSDYSASSASSSEDSDLSETDTDDDQIEKLKNNDTVNRQFLQQKQFLTNYENGKQLNKGVTMDRELDISSIITKVKGRVQQETAKAMTKEELFMLRSERICNEAKAAMQLKNPTADGHIHQDITQGKSKEELNRMKAEMICNQAKIAMECKPIPGAEVYDSSQFWMNSEHLSEYPEQRPINLNENGFQKEHFMQDHSQQLHSVLQNNLSQATTGESSTSHQEKLKYLQTLQSQLQALKQKQQNLKQEGPSPPNSNHDTNKASHSQHQMSISTVQTIPIGLVANKWNPGDNSNVVPLPNQPYPTAVVEHIKVEPQGQAGYGSSFVKPDPQKQIAEYLIHEQLVTNDLFDKQQKQFEKEKVEMKRQQENDHRRMYQQFVMQIQVAESTNLGDQKKGEMLQVFQMQQKLMLNKQAGQLQELYNKHQAQQKALTYQIEKKRKEFMDSIKSPVENHTETRIPQHDMQSFVSHSDVSPHSQPKPQLHLSVSPGSNPGMFSPSQSVSMISPQSMTTASSVRGGYQDKTQAKLEPAWHPTANRSHDSQQQSQYELLNRQTNTGGSGHIQVSPRNNAQNSNQTNVPSIQIDSASGNTAQTETRIPGFNELVEGILTCESCTFLKEYGMSKRTCSNCDSLKLKYGIVQKPLLAQTPSSLNNQLKVTNVSFPSIVSVSGNTDVSPGSHSVGHYIDGGIPTSIPHRPDGSQNYLSASHISGQESHIPDSNIHFFPVMDEGQSSYPCQSDPMNTTSSVITGQLDCPENSDQELSPVIPYTTSRLSAPISSVIPTCTVNSDQLYDSMQANVQIDSGCSVNISSNFVSRLTNDINETGALVVKSEISESAKHYLVKSEVDSLVKTEIDSFDKTDGNDMVKTEVDFRPRSQSEILSMDEVGITAEKRQVRSHSYNELKETPEINVKEENGVEVKEVEETAAKIGKKRKSSTNVAVPGWFGKGLNLKKKRKY